MKLIHASHVALILIFFSFLSCNESNPNSEINFLFEGEGNFLHFKVKKTDLEPKERYINEEISVERQVDTLVVTFVYQNEHDGYFWGYINETTDPTDIGVLIKKKPNKDKTKYSEGVYHLTYTFLNPTNREYNPYLSMDACELYDLCED